MSAQRQTAASRSTKPAMRGQHGWLGLDPESRTTKSYSKSIQTDKLVVLKEQLGVGDVHEETKVKKRTLNAKLLGDPISIVYHYGEYTEVKNADPDRYSYVDVIYDAYCGVLKDIPSGRTIKFSIKAVLPNGDESVLKEDKDVVRMFEKSTDACDSIHYYVFGLEVNEEVSNVYWVNTFEGNVMQRPNTSVVSSPSRQRTPIKRHEQKTLANRSKSGGGGSKAIGKIIAGSREVHNLSSSSEAESLDNDDVDWQQHGEGSDNQNHSKLEGCQSDGEDDEVSDGGQSGGCMSGNEEDEDQAILKCVDSNKDIDDSNILKIEKGLRFDDVNAYRRYIRDYVIQEEIEIMYLKNDKSRVTVVYCKRGCTWRIHASHTPNHTTYYVKSFNPKHSCGRVNTNKAASATWIARKQANRLKVVPHMSIKAMKAAICAKYGISLNDKMFYKSIMIANEENEGSFSNSYALLPHYGRLMLEGNPGSIVKLQYVERQDSEGKPIFKRSFVGPKACIDGFAQGCRPFNGLDGCHLKGMFGRVLLSTVSLDGNSEIFLVAYSVVESMTRDSW
ncbi:hypothetical protein NE237_011963 [Protea cynaroides]|uniref:Transposase MuDR plant domain-containing protein n=1 Tax=Protea cynaroides TaxID=273540 RepID=A0A9Q0GZ92_9MAGN|nr:hypothetical protein NE237_011963 [Protea cynaroides]